jgi:hypothetical protein
MHDEELNVPDDVLEETSAKKYLPNVAYKIKITKKPATFSRNGICKFLLEAADQEWILQKVVLMMGKYGGCRCDQLCKILN